MGVDVVAVMVGAVAGLALIVAGLWVHDALSLALDRRRRRLWRDFLDREAYRARTLEAQTALWHARYEP